MHIQVPTAWFVLSPINAVGASPSRFLKINFNVVFPPMPRSSKWPLSLRSPYQNCICTSSSPHTRHMPHPSHYFGFHPPHNLLNYVKAYSYVNQQIYLYFPHLCCVIMSENCVGQSCLSLLFVFHRERPGFV